MYIIFGGIINDAILVGAKTIVCTLENKEHAIEIASNFVSYGVSKEETWCQVYSINDKEIIWERL